MAKADETYNRLLKEILEEGIHKKDRTGTGTTSVFGKQIRFKMEDGFPLLTTKKLHTKSIIHELLWFLNGETNVKYLQDNGVSIWNEWADDNGELGPVYGKQWVNWSTPITKKVLYVNKGLSKEISINSVNQIQILIDTLHSNPDSRRMMVSAWNAGEIELMKLPPCHYGFQVYTQELTFTERLNYYLETHPLSHHVTDLTPNKLNALRVPTRKITLMWNQRSVDTFLGLPFNVASYALLLHMIAQQVNMVPYELIGSFGDTHIYDNHLPYVEEQRRRGTKLSAPTLKLKKPLNIFNYKFSDFEILHYESYPNWKNVPIAV